MKEAVVKLFSQVCNKNLFVRRLFVVATHTIPEENFKKRTPRLTLFDDPLEVQKNEDMKEKFKEKEKNVESVILDLKKRFGANSVVKAIDLDEAGTTLTRNKEIGGHKA
jgi:DNA polymerase V